LSPLVPYIELSEIPILTPRVFGSFPESAVTLKPFGLLVALGAYTGTVTALKQARRLGASDRAVLSFTGFVAVAAFVFAHVLDAVFYYPDEVAADPMLLLRLWEGLSSFGGFVGAFVGAIAWRVHYKAALLPYADIVASAFPVSWTFGRLGCTIAHDHPGVFSDFFLAVKYPDGGRHDLGFYELLITLPLAVVFLVLRRKPRPWGFYGGVMCVSGRRRWLPASSDRAMHAISASLPRSGHACRSSVSVSRCSCACRAKARRCRPCPARSSARTGRQA